MPPANRTPDRISPWRQIKRWWKGDTEIVNEIDQGGSLKISVWKPHWSADWIRAVGRYFVKHQAWIVPMIFGAAVALYLGL